MLNKRYTAPGFITRLGVLIVDIVLSALSFVMAYFLLHSVGVTGLFPLLSFSFLIVIAVRVFSFLWFRTYAVLIRYTGISDLISVLSVVAGGSFLLMGLSIVLKIFGVNIPLALLAIDFFLLSFFMAAFRIAMPGFYSLLFEKQGDKINVLLIGAGQLAAITRKVIQEDKSSNFNIVACIDDNPDITNKSIDGIKIYKPEDISEVIEEEDIQKAIFAIQNITNKRKNEIVDICLNQDVKVLQVPIQSNWTDEDFKMDQLKEIEFEDLLERNAIELSTDNISNYVKDKVVLVTGGAGSIGSELVRQLIPFTPKQIVIVDQAETPLVNVGLEIREEYSYNNAVPVIADIVDFSRMDYIFGEYKPEIVIHAAAYKHVPIMESFPREAISVNILGTKNISELAGIHSVKKFVMVSTDKAVRPTNVMGASKRIAEMFVQSLNAHNETQYITTRFGNVLGSNGSVIPRFRKQIKKGGPITVTHPDITRYFMTIPEAAQLVLEAGSMGEGGEIYLFDMGQPVKILDVAEKLIKLSGLQPYEDIDIKFTGLRPGEKLYEELLNDTELSKATHHPKITIANIEKSNFDIISKSIVELLTELDRVDNNHHIVFLMKQIVPDYKSKNSEFEKIDAAKKPSIKVS